MSDKKNSVLLILIALSLLMFTGCKWQGGVSSSKQKLIIRSSYMRTPVFLAGSVLEGLINYNTDYISTNISEGVNENEKIRALVNGSADLAFLSGPEGYMAYNGHPLYWESPQDIKFLFGIFPAIYSGLIHPGQDVRKISDLVGKRIAINTEKSVSGDLLYYFLRLNGVDKSNSVIYRVEQPEGFRLFSEGMVDFIWYNMSGEYSFLKNSLLTGDSSIKFDIISCTQQEKLKEFLSVYPVFYTNAGYGKKEKQFEEERSFAASTFLACSSSLPDDVAYDIAKVWFENLDYIGNFFTFYSGNNASVYLARKVPVPMHPGALKYFKEVGLLN